MARKLGPAGEPPRPASRASTQPPHTLRNLRCDMRRRDTLWYAAPQELINMEKHELVRRFKQALDHVHENGRLRPSDLQLPIYASTQYCKQPLQGYNRGEFDPEKLGVAYIVVPSQGRGSNPGHWNLNPVPTPLPPSRPPICPQAS